MLNDFNRELELSDNPIHICVVGHTNHGKTSTIRTLIEDANIGKVVNGPDTTKEVQHYIVTKNGYDRFYVYDTPGFTKLDTHIAEYEAKNNHLPTLDSLLEYLNDFITEKDEWLKDTLKQIKKSHLVIQIIDTREDPAIETYIDEINFLKVVECHLLFPSILSIQKKQEKKSGKM